jgi:hypothetical protein
MKQTKKIAEKAAPSIQQVCWYDIIQKCIDVHNGDCTWKEASEFAQARGVNYSQDVLRQGCRILFAAIDNGLTITTDNDTILFKVGQDQDKDVLVDSTIPHSVTTKEGETTNSYKVSGDKLQNFYSNGRVSLRAIQEFFKISDEFAITNVTVNEGNAQTKKECIGMYQLKVTLKPKNASNITLDDLAKITNEILKDKPDVIKQYERPSITPQNEKYQDRILCLTISDTHYGQLAKASVCGLEANRELTRDNVTSIMHEIVADNMGKPYERIDLDIMGDFVHADNCAKTTTKGTPQDCDGSIFEILAHACKLSIEVVNILKQLGIPITYRFVPGNHDKILGFAVAKNTEAYFHDDPSVTFEITESEVDAFLYGNVVIGIAHGEFPDSRAHNMFMGRFRELFNKAKFAEVLLGHLHQEKAVNPTGICKVRRVIQSGITEEWTAGKLFAHEYMRGVQAFTYDRNLGLVSTDYYYCKH